MKKINKHIQIARTTNVQFSSMEIRTSTMIKDLLSKYYEHVTISTVNTVADLDQLIQTEPDLVFLGLKRLPTLSCEHAMSDDDIWLPEYLDRNQIKYTGSGASAIQLDFNKEDAKVRIESTGLPTAPFFTSSPGQHDTHNLPLEFPLFVKPLTAGGGNGIGADSVVRNFDEFQQKVESVYTRYGSISLVEKYLSGREFSVAVLGHADDDELTIMPVELITEANEQGDRILGSRVKIADTERVVAIADAPTKQLITRLAQDLFQALGARDYGRIDIRMDADGTPYFLEANLVPGL
ncbi:MAG: ATP-grasp domain-containing protein, partial [Microcoleus sp.]